MVPYRARVPVRLGIEATTAASRVDACCTIGMRAIAHVSVFLDAGRARDTQVSKTGN